MSEPQSVLALARRWHDHAATLREYGAASQAEVLERCAAELEEGVEEWHAESLNLTEAAVESGYSTDHLGRMVREGKIPNAGRPGAPRIARRDLPIKPHTTPLPIAEEPEACHNSFEQIVQSVIDEGVA